MDVLDRVFDTPPGEPTPSKQVPTEPTPQEPTPITPTDPPAPEPPAPVVPPQVDEYGILSKHLGREFKSDDDITAWKGELEQTTTRLTDYQTRMEALQAERDALAESFDPMTLFASPELYTLNGLLKKFPDKNPFALTEISTKDFSKVALENPVDVLALNKLLEHPGVYQNKEQAMEDVLADYNLSDMDDVDDRTLRRMKVAATETAAKFAQIKSQIEQPKKVDLTAERTAKVQAEETRKNKIKEATEALFTKTIPDSLKAIEFPVTLKDDSGNEVTEIAFKYDIGEGFAKSKFVQDTLATLRQAEIQNATDFTPQRAAELKAQATEFLEAMYLNTHKKEIYAALRDDLVTKVKDAEWVKRHNPKPLRQDGTAPRTDPTLLEAERKQKAIIEGFGIKVK